VLHLEHALAQASADGHESPSHLPQSTSVEVILNERSGLRDKTGVPQLLEGLFKDRGIEVRVTNNKDPTRLYQQAEAAAKRSEVIVAAGGDGTANTVASAAIARHRTLGVLPLGTLNHFARDLGIPIELEEAVDTIAGGFTTLVDVGEVNSRIFLNNSTLGLYPSIVHERQKQQRLGHGKWPAFAWSAITVFRRYPFLDVKLKADGKSVESRTPFVFIGNNVYAMEGFKIGIRDRLDAGTLSVYMTLRIGRWGLFRLAVRALLGRLRYERDFVSLLTDDVSIETKRKRVRVARDGEVEVIATPLQYLIHRKALRVLAPKPDKL